MSEKKAFTKTQALMKRWWPNIC